MVNPASCTPAATADANKLTFVNGAWTFKANQSGLAKLNCPVSFSGDSAKMKSAILSFRDTYRGSGQTNAAGGYVRAYLKFRNRTASGISTAFQLQSSSVPGGVGDVINEYNYFQLLPGPPTYATNIALHPALGNIYHVEVRMERGPGYLDEQFAFTGLELRF
jgi:hypothetical protein